MKRSNLQKRLSQFIIKNVLKDWLQEPILLNFCGLKEWAPIISQNISFNLEKQFIVIKPSNLKKCVKFLKKVIQDHETDLLIKTVSKFTLKALQDWPQDLLILLKNGVNVHTFSRLGHFSVEIFCTIVKQTNLQKQGANLCLKSFKGLAQEVGRIKLFVVIYLLSYSYPETVQLTNRVSTFPDGRLLLVSWNVL